VPKLRSLLQVPPISRHPRVGFLWPNGLETNGGSEIYDSKLMFLTEFGDREDSQEVLKLERRHWIRVSVPVARHGYGSVSEASEIHDTHNFLS
jgi:hypothetical protein